jgi:hypothetical protein
MYREHAGPPPPDPYEAGRQNARNCGLMQLGTAAMNVLTLGGIVLRLPTMKLPPNLHLDPADVSAFTHTALLSVVIYMVVMGVWAAINFWGLQRRSKLAYVSSFGFGLVSIFSCLPALFGVVLIVLLLKREMKGYFGPRPTS